MYKSLNSKAKLKKILKTEGTSLSRIYGTLGRNLMFSRMKTMLEENVRSLSRIKIEELHKKQLTTLHSQPFHVIKVSLPEQIKS